MKILSGLYKGRLIRMPAGIRPTQDKVRKALFDILGDISGLSFLELFAGSGAIGFEAISRGAGEVVLVEYNRGCLLAIKRNIETLKAANCSTFIADASLAIKGLHKKGKKFDIIFFDPPYYGESSKKTLQILGVYDILSGDGLVVAQHFKKDNLPESAGDLNLFRQSVYGDTVLSFYRKA
jgi:16S rRNA (guanine966-N2)-methyltransferase